MRMNCHFFVCSCDLVLLLCRISMVHSPLESCTCFGCGWFVYTIKDIVVGFECIAVAFYMHVLAWHIIIDELFFFLLKKYNR